MKKTFLISLFLIASEAFACMGGKLELNNGNVTLTAERVDAASGMLDIHESTIDMLEGERIISWTERNGSLVEVSVADIKKDNGGVIDTYFEVTTSEGKSKSTKIIKIESNYRGNGVRSRGMPAPTPVADETYGC